MEDLTTPGKRLRYFCRLFFSSVTDFAHGMGFQKPGSLYDYFKDVKRPGGLLLDKFRALGGNPTWLRYGTGSMFAENETGEVRKLEYRNKFPYEPLSGETAPSDGKPAYDPRLSYSHAGEVLAPATPDEMLYLHLGTVQFRLHAATSLPLHVLRLYRSLIQDINQRLNFLEQQNDE